MTEPGMIRNPDLVGHLLVRPSLWTVDTTKRVFSPLPPKGKCVEVIKRIFLSLAAVLVFLPSALLFCVGLPIKAIANCCTSADGSISDESAGPPKKTEAEILAEKEEREKNKKEKWNAYQAEIGAIKSASIPEKKVTPKSATTPPITKIDDPAPTAPRETPKKDKTHNLDGAKKGSGASTRSRKKKNDHHLKPLLKAKKNDLHPKPLPLLKAKKNDHHPKTVSNSQLEAKRYTELANRLKKNVSCLKFEDNFMYLDIFLEKDASGRAAICQASTEQSQRIKKEMLVDLEYLKLYAEGTLSADFLKTRIFSEPYKYMAADDDAIKVYGKSMQVKGNGDCGLITFIYLLKIYGLLENKMSPIKLRGETIDWMKKNWETDPVLLRWILYGMDEYQQDLVGEIKAAQTKETLEEKEKNKPALRLHREKLETQQAILAFIPKFWEHIRAMTLHNSITAETVKKFCKVVCKIPAQQLDLAVSSYLDTFSHPQVHIGYAFVHAMGHRFNITCEVVPVEQGRKTENNDSKISSKYKLLRPACGDPQLFGKVNNPLHHFYLIISGRHYSPFIPNSQCKQFFNLSEEEEEELSLFVDGKNEGKNEGKDDGKGVGLLPIRD